MNLNPDSSNSNSFFWNISSLMLGPPRIRRETIHWVTCGFSPVTHMHCAWSWTWNCILQRLILCYEIFDFWCWGSHHVPGEKPTTGWPMANHLLINVKSIIMFMNFEYIWGLNYFRFACYWTWHSLLQSLLHSVRISNFWRWQDSHIAGGKPTTGWPAANHLLITV